MPTPGISFFCVRPPKPQEFIPWNQFSFPQAEYFIISWIHFIGVQQQGKWDFTALVLSLHHPSSCFLVPVMKPQFHQQRGKGWGGGCGGGGRAGGKASHKTVKTTILHLVNIFLFIGLSLYVQSYYPCTVSKWHPSGSPCKIYIGNITLNDGNETKDEGRERVAGCRMFSRDHQWYLRISPSW